MDDVHLSEIQIREKNFVSCVACIAAISLLMQDAHGVLEGIGKSHHTHYVVSFNAKFKTSTCSGQKWRKVLNFANL